MGCPARFAIILEATEAGRADSTIGGQPESRTTTPRADASFALKPKGGGVSEHTPEFEGADYSLESVVAPALERGLRSIGEFESAES